MKLIQGWTLALAIASVVAWTGCSSSQGVKRNLTVAKVLDGKAEALADAQDQIATIMTALNDVVMNANTDPTKAYNSFSKEAGRLDKMFEEVQKSNEKLKKESAEHNSEWQEQINAMSNEQLKQQATERKAAVMARYNEIQDSMQNLIQAYEPFSKNLKDLVAYLGSDLNPSGISGASDMIQGLKREAVTMQDDIQAVIEKIRSMAANISPRQES